MIAESPVFNIALQHLEADEVMPARDTVIIDALETEDISLGFMVLDYPSDIFLLRNAINAFIKKHNINPSKHTSMKPEDKDSEQPTVPAAVTILAQYMGQFAMTDDIRTPGVELKTTDDIINDLSCMCDLESNDVATLLINTGFKTYHDADGRHGWMLVRRPFLLDPNHPLKEDSSL